MPERRVSFRLYVVSLERSLGEALDAARRGAVAAG
jgi:hypothetical protein